MANTSIADVLAKAQFKPKKVLQRSSQTSTDESSPSAIAEKQVAPVFDCNGGLNLSDSDDSDDERVGNIERELVEAKQLETKNKSKKMLSDINKASGNQMDFAKVHDNLKQIEDAKKALMDYTNRPTVQAAQHELVFNIEELLMMGETSEKNLPGPSNKSKSKDSQSSQSKRARAAENESDSDWEEVTGKKIKLFSIFQKPIKVKK